MLTSSILLGTSLALVCFQCLILFSFLFVQYAYIFRGNLRSFGSFEFGIVFFYEIEFGIAV
jgi:hypothetical protein